ncbi:DUF2635 domain-containing protein [Hylemonella gracilis]|uniref:DUF2635 domain-containing protein n=1 Tax=Hylemonella gracilis TaxID=80880 RepID=UPI0012DC1321|nr:DUF2635 domain-containing protein [Hylemonella gracilis]
MDVQPVPGRLVRDPATGRELTERMTVPDGSPFWLRRLTAGDVTRADAAAAAPKGRVQTPAPAAGSPSSADKKGGSQ